MLGIGRLKFALQDAELGGDHTSLGGEPLSLPGRLPSGAQLRRDPPPRGPQPRHLSAPPEGGRVRLRRLSSEPTPHVGTFSLGLVGVTPARCGLPPAPAQGMPGGGEDAEDPERQVPGSEILLALISERFPSSRHSCCPRNAIPALLRARGPL